MNVSMIFYDTPKKDRFYSSNRVYPKPTNEKLLKQVAIGSKKDYIDMYVGK